jgi:hypothetical protein
MMTRIKKKSLLKDRRLKYGALLMGALFVVLFTSSLFFSTFSNYTLGVGSSVNDFDAIGVNEIVDESVLNIDDDYLILYIFSVAYDLSSPDEPIPELDNTVCDLVCVDNDAVIDTFSPSLKVTYIRAIPDVQDETWRIQPYFKILLDEVYQEEHVYMLNVHGGLEGTTFEFKIIGDADGPVYSEDGGGDDGIETPITPEFIDTPDDIITIGTNETINLVWTVADDNPDSFVLYYNDTVINSAIVAESEFTLTLEIGELDAAVYLIKFVFSDIDGNTISHTVTLTVEEGSDWLADILDDPMMVIVIIVVALVVLGGVGSKR